MTGIVTARSKRTWRGRGTLLAGGTVGVAGLFFALATFLVHSEVTAAENGDPQVLRVGEKSFTLDEVVYEEDFNSSDPAVWVEGNPERVRFENGRMIMDSNDRDEAALTVFVDNPFRGDLYFEYEAEVLVSDTAKGFPEPKDVNNVNTFLYYSDPEGRDFKESRDERADGAYRHYHELNGYIVTFLNGYMAELRQRARDPNHVVDVEEGTGRIRLRENPGFVLKKEAFRETSTAGRIYLMQFIFSGGKLYCFIDGNFLLGFRPSSEKRVNEGYFGFRTFGTEVAVDNFEVRQVAVD